MWAYHPAQDLATKLLKKCRCLATSGSLVSLAGQQVLQQFQEQRWSIIRPAHAFAFTQTIWPPRSSDCPYVMRDQLTISFIHHCAVSQLPRTNISTELLNSVSLFKLLQSKYYCCAVPWHKPAMRNYFFNQKNVLFHCCHLFSSSLQIRG